MRKLIFLVLFGSAGSAAQAQFKSATLKDLDAAALVALAPKIRSIRAEPATVTMRVGQTVELSSIIVVAVDSAGVDRGRIKVFDFGIKPGSPADAVPRKVTGVRPGTAELTIHYPRETWKMRTDPRPGATVKIEVKP